MKEQKLREREETEIAIIFYRFKNRMKHTRLAFMYLSVIHRKIHDIVGYAVVVIPVSNEKDLNKIFRFQCAFCFILIIYIFFTSCSFFSFKLIKSPAP